MSEKIKAAISSAVSLIVICAGAFNLTLDPDMITTIITAVVMIAVVVYDIWKNHNFTPAAELGQKIIKAVKDEILSEEEVEKFLEEHTPKHAEQE